MMHMSNRIGQVIGNYKVTRPLGKGGYAEVYLAAHIHLAGKQVAIKFLREQLDEVELAAFKSEAKYMQDLHHPRIIEILDYGSQSEPQTPDRTTPYIMMEYAPHGTLRKLYPHHTQMELSKIALYTKQIAEALQYAHDHKSGFVHRDVKPENMLVRRLDDVALSDFGIASNGLLTGNIALQEAAIRQALARNQQVTIQGTSAYMAPERIQGKTQRASDQYSLAVVVYEWFSGERPFQGSDVEVCAKHLSEPPPPLTANYSFITPAIEAVVMKGLAKNPADRYRTVMDFALALEDAIQASSRLPAAMPVPVLKPVPNTPVQQAGSPIMIPAPQSPFNIPPSPAGQDAIPGVAAPIMPAGNAQQAVPPANNPQRSQSWQLAGPSNNAAPPTLPSKPFDASMPPVGASTPKAHNIAPTMPDSSVGQGLHIGQGGYGPGNAPPPVDATVSNRSYMAPPTPQPLNFMDDPLTTARLALRTDPFFLKPSLNRWFVPLGNALNVLSGIIVAIAAFPIGIVLGVLGAAFAIFLFRRCMITVKPPVAIACGVGVALWWGFVSNSVVMHISYPDLPLLNFVVIAISIGIHVWYVETRKKR